MRLHGGPPKLGDGQRGGRRKFGGGLRKVRDDVGVVRGGGSWKVGGPRPKGMPPPRDVGSGVVEMPPMVRSVPSLLLTLLLTLLSRCHRLLGPRDPSPRMGLELPSRSRPHPRRPAMADRCARLDRDPRAPPSQGGVVVGSPGFSSRWHSALELAKRWKQFRPPLRKHDPLRSPKHFLPLFDTHHDPGIPGLTVLLGMGKVTW